MLYNYIRTFYGDNGVLTDYSIDNQDELATVPLAFVAAEDYVYIGQHFPVNNFFVQMDTINTNASVLSIEYWCGTINGWKAAVDILDGTTSGGKTFARSGVVQFSPAPAYIWQRVGDSTNEVMPTGLTASSVYNVYWLRIKASANISAGTDAKRICYAFTRSQQLDNLDVTIDQFLTSFNASKTNWDDEIVTASIHVVADLKRRGVIIHNGEIIRFEDISMACDYKTLSIIYKNLGPAYKEKLERVDKEYEKAVNLKRFTLDKDQDAFVSSGEISTSIKRLER